MSREREEREQVKREKSRETAGAKRESRGKRERAEKETAERERDSREKRETAESRMNLCLLIYNSKKQN